MAKRKTTTKPAKRPAAKPIPAKWRQLWLDHLPGYDPIVSAGPGDWFDSKAAQRPIDFFAECLKHVKGPMAGQPFVLEDWEIAIVGALFGWKRKDGSRRYREALLYVAKKNGKTAMVAGLVLYLLACDNEQGAELYSAAASRDQAALIFSHAAGMVRQESELRARLTVYGAKGGSVTKAITNEAAMSSYKCLSADANTADGANVHFAAIDELHRHKSSELAEVLQKSTAARSQPLVVYTTTADYNRESLCNTMLKRAKQVRDNWGDPSKPGYDPSFLPVVYEAHREDDWTIEATWRKANPNLGVTIPLEFMQREAKKAQETPSLQNNFRRLHCNIVTDSDEAFFDAGQWDACGDSHPGDLAGRACFAGLDLSSTRDLTALELVFPPEDDSEIGAYDVLSFFWVPRDNVEKRERDDKVPYREWIDGGYIETTEGNVVDYDVIRRRINELKAKYNIREIAIDRWNSTQLQTQLSGDGFEVVPFGQGFASMAAPTRELEKLVISGRWRHGGNPVLAWMAGNTMVEMDAAGNMKASKKKSTEKIDGIVAALMALGRAMVAEVEAESVYEKEGLVFV